ncbi:MAG: tyrosine-type recombinase/integrase [Candidatus Deferrimicrobiaceae bacterium]
MDTSFENACTKAGITVFRFHDLRHTAASHMAMAGVPLKTIGEILRHKTTAMTERYSHLTPAHKRNAVKMLSASSREDPIGHRRGYQREGAARGIFATLCEH